MHLVPPFVFKVLYPKLLKDLVTHIAVCVNLLRDL